MAQVKSVIVITGIRVAFAPELRYTPQGIAVLNLRCLAEEYVSGSGDSRKVKTHSIEITCWRGTAERTASLLSEYKNPNGKANGVGALINVWSYKVPSVRSWASMNKDTKEVQYDAKGFVMTNSMLSITASDVEVVGSLPEGAYTRAATAARKARDNDSGTSSGNWPPQDDGGEDDEGGRDIPF